MGQIVARIRKGSKHYEILVDENEALKVKKNDPKADITQAVLTEAIFHSVKSGEQAATDELEISFGTSDVLEVAKQIIKLGELERSTESMHAEQDKKYKQVVDFLSKNAVSPEGRPYTSDRIMKSLAEAHVNVKNKAIESQIGEIMDQLAKVLPIKIERKKVKLIVPAVHTGKAYGVLKEFLVSETWLSNGDLEAIIEIPTAMIFDFYDKINSATHGSVLSEEIK